MANIPIHRLGVVWWTCGVLVGVAFGQLGMQLLWTAEATSARRAAELCVRAKTILFSWRNRGRVGVCLVSVGCQAQPAAKWKQDGDQLLGIAAVSGRRVLGELMKGVRDAACSCRKLCTDGMCAPCILLRLWASRFTDPRSVYARSPSIFALSGRQVPWH